MTTIALERFDCTAPIAWDRPTADPVVDVLTFANILRERHGVLARILVVSPSTTVRIWRTHAFLKRATFMGYRAHEIADFNPERIVAAFGKMIRMTIVIDEFQNPSHACLFERFEPVHDRLMYGRIQIGG